MRSKDAALYCPGCSAPVVAAVDGAAGSAAAAPDGKVYAEVQKAMDPKGEEPEVQQSRATVISPTKPSPAAGGSRPSPPSADETSRRLGEKLLAGWRMLAQSCDDCGVPLMMPRGENHATCVSCGRVVGMSSESSASAPQSAPSLPSVAAKNTPSRAVSRFEDAEADIAPSAAAAAAAAYSEELDTDDEDAMEVQRALLVAQQRRAAAYAAQADALEKEKGAQKAIASKLSNAAPPLSAAAVAEPLSAVDADGLDGSTTAPSVWQQISEEIRAGIAVDEVGGPHDRKLNSAPGGTAANSTSVRPGATVATTTEGNSRTAPLPAAAPAPPRPHTVVQMDRDSLILGAPEPPPMSAVLRMAAALQAAEASEVRDRSDEASGGRDRRSGLSVYEREAASAVAPKTVPNDSTGQQQLQQQLQQQQQRVLVSGGFSGAEQGTTTPTTAALALSALEAQVEREGAIILRWTESISRISTATTGSTAPALGGAVDAANVAIAAAALRISHVVAGIEALRRVI